MGAGAESATELYGGRGLRGTRRGAGGAARAIVHALNAAADAARSSEQPRRSGGTRYTWSGGGAQSVNWEDLFGGGFGGFGGGFGGFGRGADRTAELEITVEEVFFHCAKAFMRSRMWHPEDWDPTAVSSRAEIARLPRGERRRRAQAAIDALTAVSGSDVLQVQRLKKRKLRLRDQIETAGLPRAMATPSQGLMADPG